MYAGIKEEPIEMTTYVALLRGINVSGHRPVPMSKLAAMSASIGLENVLTYLQSGNLVADADRDDAAGLRQRLEAAIETTFGFPVTVLLRTAQQIKTVVESNPFAAAAAENPKLVHVTFLSGLPAADAVARLLSRPHDTDTIRVVGTEAYLHCPGGYGRTKLSNPFLERELAVSATTRNWATVTRLAAMARGRRH